MEHLIKEFLSNFDDTNREGLIDTPKRVISAFKELLTPIEFNFTTFSANNYDQMIICTDIKYYTFCEHHLLPFFGTVAIGYIPKDKIVGLSKIPRAVEYFAKRLNTQEYFTQNIANFLEENLHPIGLGVQVIGRHLCQEMRGIKKESIMTTCCLKGIFLEEKVKQEFLSR